MKDLESYLGVSEKHDDDLIVVEDARILGTCEWLCSKINYVEWKDFYVDIPNVLWINGKPATGKSILAGYVISELRKSSGNCNFFSNTVIDPGRGSVGAFAL
jgi:Cdc6-like AAA superfamily ATPase